VRLSGLVVAVVLLISPGLFPQHSSGSSATSSSASSSHSSSSSGSSSASHTSSAHSSGASTSSSSHSSGGAGSHSSSAGSAGSRSSTHASSSKGTEAVREPNKTAKQDHGTAELGKKPQPEHKRVFAFLHRRRRQPAPKAPEQPVEAELRHPVCPPGQSIDKKGGCIASTTTTITSTQCPPNTYGGVSCENKTDQCASFRGQLDAAAAELRSIDAELRNAGCSATSPAQECGLLSQRREAARARYRSVQSAAPANCSGRLIDPFSL
jgi:hypothetical protein